MYVYIENALYRDLGFILCLLIGRLNKFCEMFLNLACVVDFVLSLIACGQI